MSRGPDTVVLLIATSLELQRERSRLLSIVAWMDAILTPEERRHVADFCETALVAAKSLTLAIQAADDRLPIAQGAIASAREVLAHLEVLQVDVNTKLALIAIRASRRP